MLVGENRKFWIRSTASDIATVLHLQDWVNKLVTIDDVAMLIIGCVLNMVLEYVFQMILGKSLTSNDPGDSTAAEPGSKQSSRLPHGRVWLQCSRVNA